VAFLTWSVAVQDYEGEARWIQIQRLEQVSSMGFRVNKFRIKQIKRSEPTPRSGVGQRAR
jgi:hypothetical protein